jgi:hypothetical protein
MPCIIIAVDIKGMATLLHGTEAESKTINGMLISRPLRQLDDAIKVMRAFVDA